MIRSDIISAASDLIATIAAHHGSASLEDAADVRTVVEVELDGYRCVVTRAADLPSRSPLPADDEDAAKALSPREREVAQMVCAGLTNRAIASVLDISPWTVGTHLRRIFGKLDVTSRAAMVARFLHDQQS